MISNITAENNSDTFRHLHQRKNKHDIFHLRILTKHHGRRVDTSSLWCDADCMRLRMHLSEKRQHKGSPQCALREGRNKPTVITVAVQPADDASLNQPSAEFHSADNSVTQWYCPRCHTTSISIFMVHPSRPSPIPPSLARSSSSINVRHANAFV